MLGMKTSYIIGIVVVAVVIIFGWFYVSKNKQTAQPEEQVTQTPPAPTEQPQATGSSMMASPSAMVGSEKDFTVDGSNFKFVPAKIAVKKGDKVKITFVNTGGMHNFVIDEFNVKSKTIKGGAQDVIEFTADKTGSFDYYCSVGNHRAMGMQGVLTVQ
jgi:plastocyanin